MALPTGGGGRSSRAAGDPAAEAARLAREARVTASRLIVVFGFGTGHTTQAVLALASATARVLLVILDPATMLATLSCRDVSAMLTHPRLALVVGSLPQIVADMPRASLEPLAVIAHPPLLEASAPELRPLCEMAREPAGVQRSQREQAEQVPANVERNLPAILRAVRAGRLRTQLAHRPVLLLAPGPSLESQLGTLRGSPPLTIAALDTLLGMTRREGFRVDLAVTLDATERNLRKFDGLDQLPPLIVFEEARPKAVSCSRLPLFACERGGLLDRADRFLGLEGRYVSRGSVLLAAVDVLLAVGVAPLILAGADLALTGGRAHAGHGRRVSVAQSSLTVPGRSGGRVPTAESLWRHRRRLIRRVHALPPAQLLDATAAGAEIPCLTRITLQEALRLAEECEGSRSTPRLSPAGSPRRARAQPTAS
ncbi:MAG: DUF115 domain-containing protein [Acidobacteriota bacterium]|nr:MAG: DUF115 domain-containing protein [Acidobacteriota bacterium]